MVTVSYSPEYHLHVPGGAPASHSPGHVALPRGGDEVVALPRLELHLHRGRRERSGISGFSNLVQYCFELQLKQQGRERNYKKHLFM